MVESAVSYSMKTVVSIIVVILLAAGIYYALTLLPASQAENQQETQATTTSQLSGTVVAPEDATSTPHRVEAAINQKVSALGVSVTPIEVLEDSRCPEGVQCIWAGTVRIRATLSSGMGTASQEFKLNESVTTEAETITLVDVTPKKDKSTTTKPGDYRFVFVIEKR